MGASGIWHPQVRLLKPARALVLYPSSPLLKSAVAMDPRTSCLESLSPSPSVPDICLGSLTILWKTQYMDMTAPSAPNKTASEFALKEPTFFFSKMRIASQSPPIVSRHPGQCWERPVLFLGVDIASGCFWPVATQMSSRPHHCCAPSAHACVTASATTPCPPHALSAPGGFRSDLQALLVPSIRPWRLGCSLGHDLLWSSQRPYFALSS